MLSAFCGRHYHFSKLTVFHDSLSRKIVVISEQIIDEVLSKCNVLMVINACSCLTVACVAGGIVCVKGIAAKGMGKSRFFNLSPVQFEN